MKSVNYVLYHWKLIYDMTGPDSIFNYRGPYYLAMCFRMERREPESELNAGVNQVNKLVHTIICTPNSWGEANT